MTKKQKATPHNPLTGRFAITFIEYPEAAPHNNIILEFGGTSIFRYDTGEADFEGQLAIHSDEHTVTTSYFYHTANKYLHIDPSDASPIGGAYLVDTTDENEFRLHGTERPLELTIKRYR